MLRSQAAASAVLGAPRNSNWLRMLDLRRDFALLVTIALMLVGGFSLSRIDPGLASLGVLGEARYWLGLLLVLTMVGPMAMGRQAGPGRKTWQWLGLFVALHLLVATSILWAASPPENVAELLDIALLVVVIVIAVPVFSASPEAGIHLLLKAAVVASVGFMIFGAVRSGQIVGDISELGVGGIGLGRIHGVAIIGAVYLWQKGQSRYWIMAVPVCLAGTMQSGSRAATLSVLLTGLLLLPLLIKGRKLATIGLAVVIGVVGVVVFRLPVGGQVIDLFWSTVWLGGYADSPALEGLYYADRDRFLRESWELFKQSPVWGMGFGAFAHASDVAYPHNLLLSIAVDSGLLGLSLMAIILMWLMKRWLEPKNLEQSFAGAAGIFYFMCSMFAGSYYDARLMWLFWLLFILPPSNGAAAGIGPSSTLKRIVRVSQRRLTPL